MCGLVGIVSGPRIKPPFLNGMLTMITHRGPDDYGWLGWSNQNGMQSGQDIDSLISANVFMGHRRLSILDLTEAGRQPMSSLDGRYHIVFNGEIYNYLELKDELKSFGFKFHSSTDTEVLLAGYINWGQGVVDRIIGMFAFAILDTVKEKLFIARDRFGIKPLFFSYWEKGFAFSSEIPPLLKIPHIKSHLNPLKIYQYLNYGMTGSDEQTLLSDVHQLQAAHFLELDINQAKIDTLKCYWKIELNQPQEISFTDAAKQLKELFLESVELHLRSDVPIGAALSGGIDSSAIACSIRYLNPTAELHTFTYVADDNEISEEKWADIVGKRIGAIMHKVTPTAPELVADLDHLIGVQGEPFGSTSIYAQHRVFRLAHQAGIKVMLDGQGADELLAGYSGYAGARLASLVYQLKFLEALKFLNHAAKWPDRNSSMLIKKALSYFVPECLQPIAMRFAGRKLVPSWMNKEWFKQNQVNLSLPVGKPGPDCLREELLTCLDTTRIPHLLRYEDRNSMAYSIESRVPFLNHKLVEFIYTLPEEYLMDKQGKSKAVFREAMRGIVPDEVLDRKDKIGFVTPEHKWLSLLQPWVEQLLQKANNAPMLHYTELCTEWKGVLAGKRQFNKHIWRCLNYLRWLELNDIPGILSDNQ